MGAAEQQALIEAQRRQSQQLRENLLGLVRQQFADLPNYRDADARRFLEQTVPSVVGAQRMMAEQTLGYLLEMLSDMLGRRIPPPEEAVPAQLPDELRGVPLSEVYLRPFHTLWTALSRGQPLDTAITQGMERAETLAATDLQLAKTHTARAVMTHVEGASGYRRVPQGVETCAMCLIASTQRYHRDDLMPIHPGCDCGVAPLPGGEDPGQIIDEETLEATHDAVEEAFGAEAVDRGGREPDYRKLIVTREHGEYGPTLAVAGHRFTGASELGLERGRPDRGRGASGPSDPEPGGDSDTPSGERPADAGDVDAIARSLAADLTDAVGHEVSVDLEGADAANAADIARGLREMADRYRGVDLHDVAVTEFPPEREAHAVSNAESGTIFFNAASFADRSWTERVNAAEEGTGFTFRGGAGPYAVAIHEFAHLLDLQHEEWRDAGGMFTASLPQEFMDFVESSGADTETAGAIWDFVENALGKYAGSSIEEMIAEAFTDYTVNGESAHALSQLIGRRLHRAWTEGRDEP